MSKNAWIKLFLSLILVLSAALPYMATAKAAEPITVAEAIANNTGTQTVKGYIVGTTATGPKFNQVAPFTVPSNLGIADSPDETDPTKILPVELPSKSAARTELNLVDNPSNFKAEVVITGSLQAYFGVPGLKSPTAFTILSDGETPPPAPSAEKVDSIAEARATADKLIEVEGTVTTGTGFWGGKAFYVQDETGGIYVYTSTDYGLTPGDNVKLTGKVSLYSGELQLQPSDVKKLSSNNQLPALQTLTPAGIGEDTQGELIELKNVTITDLKSFNYGTFEFTALAENGESITIRNDNRNGLLYDQFIKQYKEGDLIHVTGIASKFNASYQVKTLGSESFDLVNKPAVYVDIFPGIVSEGTEITLQSGWENAAIYYTIDGSNPTTASTKYTAPIELTKDTVIKAIAVGDNTSEVFTFNYTVLKTKDLKIRDIQGKGHYSEYQNNPVAGVTGVVTHLYNTANFVIQDTNPDNDITTSEAIMVNKQSHGLKVGDVVTVGGTVEEHFQEGYADAKDNDLPITRIRATDVVKDGTAELPAPIIIGKDVFPPTKTIDSDGLTQFNPDVDGIDFWESLELMRVGVADAQIVGPQSYGEVIVVSKNATNNAFHKQGGILIAEDDYNPERIAFDIDNEKFLAKAGDSFDGTPVGVLGFGFGNYKIWAVESDLPKLVDGGTAPEQTWIQKQEDKLTVASYNVENFSADPSHTSNEKAARIAESFVEDLNSPDIIVMVEVQDNDGPITSGNSDATATYERLISEIEKAKGPTYEWTDIAPEYNKDGGEPGGNIRVGYLYNPERVTLSEGTKGSATETNSWVNGELALNPGRVQPIPMPGTRKPLAAQFEFQGEQVVVIGAHLNSKGGDQPLFGKNQPPTLGSVPERIELAKAINGFIKEGLAQNPNLNVVVAGDMNDFEFTPALAALKGDVLANKVEDVPVEDRYSYYYQGNSQVLDHVLVTKNLKDRTEIDMIHINSMFMEEHGRASDHDPVLVQMDLKKPVIIPENPSYPNPPVEPEKPTEPEKPEVLEPVTFDDIQTHWAKKQIEALASKGIVFGKSTEAFEPESKLSRSEFAVLLARALELPLKEYEGTFKDVRTSKAWAYQGIEAAARAGIVFGKTDGTYDPDAEITREEIAAMMIRAIEYQDASLLEGIDASHKFADAKNVGKHAVEAVAKAYGLGIISGRVHNKFDPKADITRAETIVILYRGLDKLDLLD
ncbi:S-layer homology domain-containing protein [Planococcus ruber]|uniref:S-layer homology domain-containing protein n=1 Tax=Planococcus ruber TaxID=2027871 RepID=UPI001FEE01E0|nr:S-layer homology domain-containing protein [Planococcus ruber]MCJ1908246.1 S-layer homology domain-containing protein [Planococcus ruber]